MEHLADLGTAGDELVAGSLDVGDDQVEALRRAGHGRRDVRPELDRARRARRRELDDPEAVVEGEVGVEPPPEAAVELFARSTSETGITTTSSFMSAVPSLGVPVALSPATGVLPMSTSLVAPPRSPSVSTRRDSAASGPGS